MATKKKSMLGFLEKPTGTPMVNRDRPLAKSKDPDYAKVGLYLKADTLRAVKGRLAGDEISDLFERLASTWLKSK